MVHIKKRPENIFESLEVRTFVCYNSRMNTCIDFICQHNKDGSIIPLKIRLQDEDGIFQEYKVHGYKDVSSGGITRFDCKINVMYTTRIIRIFESSDGVWHLK